MSTIAGRRSTGRAALTIAVAGAPTAWMVHLLVSYLLVPVACGQDSNVLLHVTTFLTALAAVAGGAVAARIRRDARSADRGRAFVALAGMAMSPLFLLLIVVGGASPVLIGPCAG